METPLNASARSAGSLISNNKFVIPQFQREYSWQEEEVLEFWNDLRQSISDDYFIGLVILTEPGNEAELDNQKDRRYVVDGQQRLITLTLIVAALHEQAKAKNRSALADRLRADFLTSIDYKTDATESRILLSDKDDNETLQHIIKTGSVPNNLPNGEVSQAIAKSYATIQKSLEIDLRSDPFKRLGAWSEFLTTRLYMAVFVHPDASTAYQVYEVINTRGRDLTTADLLKNYILSQVGSDVRQSIYDRWKEVARQFEGDGGNSFVQFIRHAVTVDYGYVLPKDLFSFIAKRGSMAARRSPEPIQLLELLEKHLPLYRQMFDQTFPGPAEAGALAVFSALNDLNVITVRPMLLAIAETAPDAQEAEEGLRATLQLVVRRIVVGNLGTGNVERRFGEAAKKIHDTGDWRAALAELGNLNPLREDFERALKQRRFNNKSVLTFLRRSIAQRSQTPQPLGTLHYIWTPADADQSLTAEEASYWAATLGNTFLAKLESRPHEVNSWVTFKARVLPEAVHGEIVELLRGVNAWDMASLNEAGLAISQIGGQVWY